MPIPHHTGCIAAIEISIYCDTKILQGVFWPQNLTRATTSGFKVWSGSDDTHWGLIGDLIVFPFFPPNKDPVGGAVWWAVWWMDCMVVEICVQKHLKTGKSHGLKPQLSMHGACRQLLHWIWSPLLIDAVCWESTLFFDPGRFSNLWVFEIRAYTGRPT